MPDPDVVSTLEQLDRATEPAVTRFDPGPPFAGRVAVLPSAFNPPTVAHMELLSLGRSDPGIDSMAALLTTRNVDKGLHGASLAHRVEMLLAMSANGTTCAVLAANVARIADQARALRNTYGRIDFDFVVGYDTLVRLFDSRYYDDMSADLNKFFAHHRVIAANRGEVTVTGVQAFLERDPVARRYRDCMLIRELDEHPASLSSTAVREAAARGDEHPAVCREVADYILRHRLYREH